ncbi:putative type IX sorting system protein PorV2 [Aureibaculum marinum]|uniref:putative type IX sorting system protein PorV2 n=1 Tax=Aureibaculum marinum TaxID=2487930 RepID=UPI000F4ECF29|nr:PorV/PorQ family protein [Aureibaculum marinum]
MKQLLLIVLFTTAQISSGQTIRNFSNEFLNIGVDAASFGMGKAVTAFSNDVNSIYWNPAGLVGLKDYQGSLMHAEYFQGIANYDYVGFAKPINNESTVAVAVMRFGVDDILNTTQLIQDGQINYDRVSLFSAADWAVNVAYAKKLILKDLNIGVNAKIVRRKIGDFASSIGFGLDAGLQFKRNQWEFGLMLRDITTTFNAWSFNDDELDNIIAIYDNLNESILNDDNPDNDDEIIPTVTPDKIELTKPKAQLGIARKFNISRDFNLLTALDLNMRFAKTNDVISSSVVSISPAFGFQVDYINRVYVRGGINNFQNQVDFENNNSLTLEPNFGVGFNYKGISIDYALTNIGGASGTLFSNVFSLKVDISYFR